MFSLSMISQIFFILVYLVELLNSTYLNKFFIKKKGGKNLRDMKNIQSNTPIDMTKKVLKHSINNNEPRYMYPYFIYYYRKVNDDDTVVINDKVELRIKRIYELDVPKYLK